MQAVEVNGDNREANRFRTPKPIWMRLLSIIAYVMVAVILAIFIIVFLTSLDMFVALSLGLAAFIAIFIWCAVLGFSMIALPMILMYIVLKIAMLILDDANPVPNHQNRQYCDHSRVAASGELAADRLS